MRSRSCARKTQTPIVAKQISRNDRSPYTITWWNLRFCQFTWLLCAKKGIVTPCEELLSFFMKFVWPFYYSTVFLKNKEFCKNTTKLPVCDGFGTFPSLGEMRLHFTMLAKKMPWPFSWTPYQNKKHRHWICKSSVGALSVFRKVYEIVQLRQIWHKNREIASDLLGCFQAILNII